MVRALLRPGYVATHLFWIHLKGLVTLPWAAMTFWRMWHTSDAVGIGACAQGRTVVMIAVADMRVDPRVEREARALAAAGFEVVVIWTDPVLSGTGIAALIDWGPRITFHSVPQSSGEFSQHFPGFLGPAMLTAALAYRPFAFHGHDLSTALIALTAARRSGAHAVCDYHEWYSENVTWHPFSRVYRPHSWPRKAAYRWLERLGFRHASGLVTVCDSIADAMTVQMGDGRLKVEVIRNIPDRSRTPSRAYAPLKHQFNLPEATFVMLWQGGLGPSRMIEPVIEALAFAPLCTFVIRGPDIETYGPSYRAIATRAGTSDRLILAPPVPSQDVVAAARGADIGVWTLPDLCKNFSFALPNKIFEYLASDLPLLVANYPEARRLACDYDVGLTFDPYDPRSIAEAINRFVENPDVLNRCRKNIPIALHKLDADAEWGKLVAIYTALENQRSPQARADCEEGA